MESISVESVEIESNKLPNSRNVDKRFLDLFTKVTESKEDVKLNSSLSIIQFLLSKQRLQNQETDGEQCHELKYTVNRLVRGMSSTRKSARQSYCVLLAQILELFSEVEIDEVIQLVEKNLSVSDKQDKCPMTIGRLLVYTSLVRSGRLFNSPYLSLVAVSLYQLSLNQFYLQEATYKLFLSLFAGIDEQKFVSDVWPHLKKELSSGWEKASPDKLWLLLLIHRIYPSAMAAKFLRKHWNGEDLLAEDNIPNWKRIIRQSTILLPQLHPVCIEFLNVCIQKKVLKNVWHQLIDDNLFDENEKSCLGFLIVKEALRKVNKYKQVNAILSPRFCFIFTRAYCQKTNILHAAANTLAEFLCEYVQNCSDSKQQVVVLTSLLQISKKSYLFSQILKKKEISKMILNFRSDSVKQFSEFLKRIIFEQPPTSNKGNDDEEEDVHVNFRRHQAVLQIGSLVSHPAVANDVEWRIETIKFLFRHSFFSIISPNELVSEIEYSTEDFDESLRQVFVNCFTKASDSFSRRTGSGLSPLMQLLQCLESIFKYASTLITADECFKPLFIVSEIEASWNLSKKLLKKLKKLNKGNNADKTAALQVLLLQLSLLLFQEADQTSCFIRELEACCKKTLNLEKMESKLETETEVPWIEVVLDILLSLLSGESHHMCSVVNSVFPLVCPFMTKTGLQLILNIISPDEDDDITDNEDENGEEEEEIDFESGTSSEGESGEEDGGNENEEIVNDEFRLKIQKALGPAAHDGDETDDNDEVVLTDSEMFELDGAIAAAFKSRKKSSHTSLSTLQRNSMKLKMRCLDLLVTYLKTEPSLYHVLNCIKPVISAYEFGRVNRYHEPISNKALNILKTMSKTKKFQDQDEVSVDDLVKILDYLLNKCRKETNAEISNSLYTLCVFLVLCERKLVLKIDPTTKYESSSTCLSKYLEALEQFVNRSDSHIKSQMFVMLMNTCPEYAWLFLKPLKKYSFQEDTRLYYRTQCLGLLLVALKFSKGQSSMSEEKWNKFIPSLFKKIVEALTLTIESGTIKSMYVIELLDLLIASDTILKEKCSRSMIRDHSNLLPLLQSLSKSQCKDLGHKGKSLRRKIILLLGGTCSNLSAIGEDSTDRQTELSSNGNLDVVTNE